MIEQVIKWLPLVITFIAGWFALQQIRSNNITNARIKWLENLRFLISDFFSECANLSMKEGIISGLDEKRKINGLSEKIEAQYDKFNESFFDHFKNINLKHDLIKLNLNHKETLHKKFETIFDQYVNYLNQIPEKKKNRDELNSLLREMDNYSDTMILLLRYILKLEWEKTKRSYISRKYYFKYGNGKSLLNEALDLTIQKKTGR